MHGVQYWDVWFRRASVAISSLAALVALAMAASIVLPSPDGYVGILAVRFSEHSLQVSLASMFALALTGATLRFAGALQPCIPAFVCSLVALAISLLPPLQAAQIAARYSIPLDPLRTLRAAPTAAMPYTTVTYSRDNGDDLQADVFRPSSASGPAPAVIAIHGGGWDSGRRTDYLDWHVWLAQHGFVVFAIDYTLDPQPNWPAAALDVEHAIDWVHQNARTYGVDPQRVALVGRSAGGHLALLAAYARGGPSELPAPSRRVQAVVALYAPTDLVWGFEHPANLRVYDIQEGLHAFLGGDPQSVPDRYAQASPTQYVRSGAPLPPTLLVHGGHDQLVPTMQMYELADELRQANVPTEAVEIPYAQHAFDLPIEGWSSQLLEGLLLRFFSQTLKTP